MTTPILTDDDIKDFIAEFFKNWAHLERMADGLQRIAAVLEEMQRDAKKLSEPFEVTP